MSDNVWVQVRFDDLYATVVQVGATFEVRVTNVASEDASDADRKAACQKLLKVLSDARTHVFFAELGGKK
jgi:hypothetical protein